MTDLYHIPGDDHKDFRLKKFVEYQHEVPSIHYRFLGEWIKLKRLNLDDAVMCCWYMSVTYNEITCMLLFKMLNEDGRNKDFTQFWTNYKDKLNFGSARKYAKNMDWFVPLMEGFNSITNGNYYEWVKGFEKEDGTLTYKNVQKELHKINFVGRFASDLFLECLIFMKDYLKLNISEPFELDWKNCSNLTSGIFNIFYEDKKANAYDKTGIITKDDEVFLTEKLEIIQKAIHSTYPEQDSEISMFIGKICSFRNLFKNARYAGFHHDRELGVIKDYEKIFPEYQNLWDECYDIRKRIFDHKWLGELNGWNGIRPERKKYWLKYGLTCAEQDVYVDDCKLF